MSYHFGPQVITNGLEFYYDAGAANGYNSTTNSLRNLANGAISGSNLLNYSASLSSSGVNVDPRNGGCLYVPSSLTYALLMERYVRSDYISDKTDMTIGVWFYCSGSFPTGTTNGTIFYSLGNGNQIIFSTSNVGLRPFSTTFQTYYNSGGTITINTGTNNAWAPNAWSYWAASISGGQNAQFFGNGTFTSGTPLGTPSSITTQLRINEDSYPLYMFQNFVGYIGPISIYNRALSQSEMFYNYNRMKQRFNNF